MPTDPTTPESIETTVRCFTVKSMTEPWVWAQPPNKDGIHYDGNGKYAEPSSFPSAERAASVRKEITPAEALAKLDVWPEGQAALRKLFAEYPAEPKPIGSHLSDMAEAKSKQPFTDFQWQRVRCSFAQQWIDILTRRADHPGYSDESAIAEAFRLADIATCLALK